VRNSFINKLIDIAEKDKRVVLMTGDLGFSVLEPFAEKFPERFFNVGVSEQNMLAMATSIAEAGFIPFVYSIATFSVLRPFEFIRNGAILHQVPVRIVAVGAGYEYGNLGTTHHLIEDIALMRSQHGIESVIPVDAAQAVNALEQTYALNKPLYFRLGKDEKITVPSLQGKFDLNNYTALYGGKDVLIISLGPVANEADKAVAILENQGVKASLLIIDHLDSNSNTKLLNHIKNFEKIITVEDHSINGGIGSLVSEVIAENGVKCKFKRLGCNRKEDGYFGGREFMYKKFGFDFEGIVKTYQQM
jgi:transketolase